MTEHNLDQFFRKKLNELEPAVPTEAEWMAARSLLKGQRDRDRGFLWWLLLMGIFNVLLIFSTYPEVNLPERLEIESTSESTPMVHLDATERSQPSNPIDIIGDAAAQGRTQVTDADKDLSTKEGQAIVHEKRGQSSEDRLNDADRINSEGYHMPGIKHEDKSGLIREDTSQLKGSTLTLPKQIEADELRTLAVLDPLTEDLRGLEYQYDISGDGPHLITSVLAKPKYRANRYAWTGTLLMSPGGQIDQPVRGLQLGYLAEFYVKKNLLLGLRPSLQVTMNEFGFSKFQMQTTYGFSAVNETYGLRASSLQFVRLPAYLAMEIQKHTFEFGAGVNWLLAARGQLQQVEFEDNDVELVHAFSSGWIDTDAMQSLSYDLFFGYKFLVNSRMKIGVSFFYNPENIYPSFGQQHFSNRQRWHMGMQLNYYTK